MRHTLYAKTKWDTNINNPDTARPSQSGHAASTDMMNGLPDAQVSPCTVPATESTIT